MDKHQEIVQMLWDESYNSTKMNNFIKDDFEELAERIVKLLTIPDISVSDCDELLNALDEYARDYDSYDYGLPIGFVDSDDEMNEQREIVKKLFHSR